MIRPQDRPRRGEDSKGYELEEPRVVGPPLPGEVIAAETVDGVVDLLAAEMVVQAKLCVRRFGDFELALSGGTTPIKLYERLMYDPDCRSLPWPRTHLWQVDERVVPAGDKRANFRLIDETIVQHSGIPREQVHPFDTASETADADYARQLREVLQWRQRGDDRLDFVLLGMGDDGHTASLFPINPALDEADRLVCRVSAASAEPPQRLTMTYPLINDARVIAVLVTGTAKAEMVHRVATGHESREELPIKGIRPQRGELKWFLDAGACSRWKPQ